uniref:Sodium voltage-gated channel beta subunit 2 n=1 Tax=Oryctolagus cuniculus TaxID=9986 RepID=A0A5F9DAJ0_RABIT
MHRDAWLPRPAFSLTGLTLMFSLVPPGQSMEVSVPTILNVLNGSDARLSCTFNSCYTVNHKQFSLNWTYQECGNCSEEMVSPGSLPTHSPEGPAGGLEVGVLFLQGAVPPGMGHTWVALLEGASSLPRSSGGLSLGLLADCPAPPCPLPPPQFLQFRMKIINLRLERFRDRVEFSGNPSKYDVSVMLRNVQPEDEGTYNCYVMNPPDRHRGHGKISLRVLMEEPPERDSTVAVIVGASVGGFLAVVILVLMVVKCVRRKKEQKLSTDDLKTEEEAKTDGEANADDGTK